MLFGHGISAILIFLLATLTSTGVIAIWHIAAIFVLLGIVWALTDPASMAIIPSLVTPDDLLNAMAMNTFAWQIGRLIGSAIAGVLMALVALGGTFYGSGIAFVVTFILVFLIRAPTTITAKRTSMGKDLKEGLSYIKSNKLVLMLMLMMAVVALFAFPYIWLMPVFARDVLGIGEAGYSQLMMAVGAGGLVGAITVAKLGDFERKGWLLIGSALIFTVTLILFAMSRFFPLSLVLSVIIGGASGIFSAVMAALLLSIIPDQFRGRVMGLYIISWYLPSIGSLMLGAVTDWVGLPVAVMTGAIICIVFILGVALRLPALRRL
jgi:MFS family permease